MGAGAVMSVGYWRNETKSISVLSVGLPIVPSLTRASDDRTNDS